MVLKAHLPKMYIKKDYKSANTITFDAIAQGADLFGKATFVMDRGYDDNKMFLKLDELGQEYVIRLTSKRKLLYPNKRTPATELRNRRKGKVKTNVFFRNKYTKSCNYKNSSPCERKSFLLLLPTGKRHLRHTFICQRGRQALVPDETSGIPSTLP